MKPICSLTLQKHSSSLNPRSKIFIFASAHNRSNKNTFNLSSRPTRCRSSTYVMSSQPAGLKMDSSRSKFCSNSACSCNGSCRWRDHALSFSVSHVLFPSRSLSTVQYHQTFAHALGSKPKCWLSPDSYRQLTSSAFSKLIDTRRGPATSYDALIRRKPRRKPRPEMLKSIWFVASFRSASMLCVKFPSEMRLRRPSLVRRLPCSTCQHASERSDNQRDSATYLWRHSFLSSSDQRLHTLCRQHACEHGMQQGLRQP